MVPGPGSQALVPGALKPGAPLPGRAAVSGPLPALAEVQSRVTAEGQVGAAAAGEPGGPTRKLVRSALAKVDEARQRNAEALGHADHLLGVIGRRPLLGPDLRALGQVIETSRSDLTTALEDLAALERLLERQGAEMPDHELQAAKKALAAVRQELLSRSGILDRLARLLRETDSAGGLSPAETAALEQTLAELRVLVGTARKGLATSKSAPGTDATSLADRNAELEASARDAAVRDAQLREAQRKQREEEEKAKDATRRRRKREDADRAAASQSSNHHDRIGQDEFGRLYADLMAERQAESLRKLRGSRAGS